MAGAHHFLCGPLAACIAIVSGPKLHKPLARKFEEIFYERKTRAFER
jgi:hypothetical protein